MPSLAALIHKSLQEKIVWSAVSSTFIHSLLSPVSTGGALVDLDPPIETWHTRNQWSFCEFLECQAPPAQTQSPLLKTF